MCLNPFTQFLKLKWAEKSRSGMKTNTCKAHKWVRPNSVSNIFLPNKNKRPNATEMAWTPSSQCQAEQQECVANWRASVWPCLLHRPTDAPLLECGANGAKYQGSPRSSKFGFKGENFWLPSQRLLLYKSNVFASKTYLNCWFENDGREKRIQFIFNHRIFIWKWPVVFLLQSKHFWKKQVVHRSYCSSVAELNKVFCFLVLFFGI